MPAINKPPTVQLVTKPTSAKKTSKQKFFQELAGGGGVEESVATAPTMDSDALARDPAANGGDGLELLASGVCVGDGVTLASQHASLQALPSEPPSPPAESQPVTAPTPAAKSVNFADDLPPDVPRSAPWPIASANGPEQRILSRSLEAEESFLRQLVSVPAAGKGREKENEREANKFI